MLLETASVFSGTALVALLEAVQCEAARRFGVTRDGQLQRVPAQDREKEDQDGGVNLRVVRVEKAIVCGVGWSG